VGVAFGSTQLLANTHTDTLLIGKQKTGKKKQLIFLAPFMCRGKQFSHYAYARWYRINVIKTYLLFGAQNLFAASWLAATYVNLFFLFFIFMAKSLYFYYFFFFVAAAFLPRWNECSNMLQLPFHWHFQRFVDADVDC